MNRKRPRLNADPNRTPDQAGLPDGTPRPAPRIGVPKPSGGWSCLIRLIPRLLLPLLWFRPLSAQRVPELGLQALATLSDHSFAGGGGYGALRLSERGRVAVTAGFGGRQGTATFRGEILGHFMLNPTRVRGIGVYGLGGLAWEQAQAGTGYLVLGAGVESAPGSPHGWAAEFGLGGGVRVTLGFRWRRVPAEWRSGG